MVNYIKRIILYLFFLILILVFIYNILDTVEKLHHNFWCCVVEKKLYAITLALGIVSILAFFYLIVKKIVSYKPILLFTSIILIFIITAIFVILNTEIRLIGDPLEYFRSATDVLTGKEAFNIANISHQRSLFYTLPIFFFLPNSLFVLQLCNIVLILLTGFLIYRLISSTYDKKIAIITLILFLFFPIQYGVLSLPYHDNISNLYFLLFLVLINVLMRLIQSNQNILFIFLTILGSAIFLFFADTVRSTGLFIIISLILSLVFLFQFRNYKYYIAILSVIIVFSFIKSYKTSLYPENNSFNKEFGIGTIIYSYNDLLSKGGFWQGRESRSQFALPFLESKEIKDYAITKYSTQVAEYPLEYLKTFFTKINFLFQTTTRSRFFSDIGSIINDNFHAFLIEIEKYFRVIIFLFAVVGLFILSSTPVKNYSLTVFIFFGLMFIPIISLSQVNPGYSYIILPQICFWSAIGIYFTFNRNIKSLFTKKILNYHRIRQKTKFSFSVGITFLFCFLVFVGFMKAFKKYNSFKLYDFDKNIVTLYNAHEILPHNSSIQPHYSLLIKPEEITDTIKVKIPIASNNYSSFTVFFKSTALNLNTIKIQNKKPDFFGHSMDRRPERAINGIRNYYMVKYTLNENDSLIHINLTGLKDSDSITSTIEIKDLFLTKY